MSQHPSPATTETYPPRARESSFRNRERTLRGHGTIDMRAALAAEVADGERPDFDALLRQLVDRAAE